MALSLSPIEPPLGPQPPSIKFYTPNQVTLVMKEKVFSWSFDNFNVKTTEGFDICICKGKVLSVREKKKFTDMQENEIFTLSNKMFAIQRSFYGEAPSGHNFEIKGKFKLLGSKSEVLFKNGGDGKDIILEVNGDWLDRKAEITWEGRPVAAISRQFFNARQFLGGDTYFVTVAGNVDLTLIAAICVALDERENAK